MFAETPAGVVWIGIPHLMKAATVSRRMTMIIAQEIAARPAMPYRLQFCQGNEDITWDPWRETYSDNIRAWSGAHGDLCLADMVRTPRGRWRLASSDVTALPVNAYDRRFLSPLDALAYIAGKRRSRLVEAVCRCGSPDSCD